MRLQIRLTLFIIVLCVVIGGTTALLVSDIMHSTLEQELEKRGVVIAQMLAEHVTHNVIDGEVVAAREALQEIVRSTENVEFAYIVGFDGNVFAHSFENGFPRALLPVEQELIRADSPHLEKYSTKEGLGLLVGYPLIDGMKAHLHLGLNEIYLHDQIERTRNQIIAITSVVALVTVLLGIVLSNRIARPLEQLSECLQAFGEKRVEQGLDYRGGGREVADLTHSFNLMIIERKQAEEALRAERNFAESLVDTAQVIILVLDTKGRIVRFNKFMEELSGYALAEVQGKDYFSIFLTERNQTATRVIFQKALEGIQIKGNINVIVTREGRERLIEWHDKMLSDADGNAVGVLAIGPDVTERVQAEEALRESERRIRNIIEHSDNLFYQHTSDHILTYLSPQTCQFFDCEPEEAMVHWTEFTTDNQINETGYALTEKAIHTGEKQRPYELELVGRKGRKIWVEVNEAPLIEGGEVVAMIGALTDITKRKLAEERVKMYTDQLEEMVTERTQELRKAQKQLIRREKMASLGQLAGSVAHELRNPLGVISNSIYYLKLIMPDPDDNIRESLELINSEIQIAVKIISDLLDFGRVLSVERVQILASELIAQVLEKHPAPESVELSTQVPLDLPLVFVDPAQMVQVITNLVTNAYQAMPEGGGLLIEAAPKGEFVRLAITDSGSGISQKNIENLFEPLFTTKARGIGLGLANSKNLAEANGAAIEVTSVVGQGSTFTVCLPISV